MQSGWPSFEPGSRFAQSKECSCSAGRRRSNLFLGNPDRRCNGAENITEKARLASTIPRFLDHVPRCEEWGIRLEHQPLQWNSANRIPQMNAATFITDPAG